ncbi:MAG TPA: hypothetical protein VF035_08905 [Longimicrobiales bacterium]
MRRSWLLAAALVAVVGCDDGSGSTGIATEATYSLIALQAPYGPGYEFLEPTTCGRFLRSSITDGTVTFTSAGTWEMELTATLESLSGTGEVCEPIVTTDISRTVSGTVADAASGQPITMKLDAGDTFATGSPLGPTLPVTIELNVTGSTTLGAGVPFDALTPSTWARIAAE